MFVLDTNVLSALTRPERPPAVAAWLQRQTPGDLFTTAICQAEMMAGLAIMAASHRRAQLAVAITAMFTRDFAGRVLAFGPPAAEAYGEVFALRRHARLATPIADLMIAAVARSHSAAVVTRNTADFEHCGVAVVNPWAA